MSQPRLHPSRSGLRTVLCALLVVVLAACAALPEQAATGSLRVTIDGIDVPADVRVTRGGFLRELSATTTIEDLAPGSYEVTAAVVTVAATTFTAVVTGSPAEVTADATTEVNVSYTRNDPPEIAGLADAEVVRNTLTPRSVTLVFDVTDANGDALTVTAEASDTSVLPDPLEPVCDPSGACELTLTPVADATADTTVTIRADDGRGGVATASAAVSVAPMWVTSDASSGPGSLRAQVAAAEAGDVIGFEASVRGTIALTSEISIETPLTIEGPGAAELAVSGGDATRLLRIGAVAVAISDLALEDGAASDDGGAVHSSGELTLSGVTVRSGAAGGLGGGVFQQGGSLSVIGGELTDNTAGEGGGLAASDAAVVLDGTTLSGNVAADDGGASVGGGGARVSGGSVLVTGASQVFGNRAHSGGGLFLLGAEGRLDGESAVFVNAATSLGGGVYLYASTFTMTQARIGGDADDGNEASSGGGIGGFYNPEVRLETGAVIEANRAGGSGGGLFLLGAGNSEIHLDGAAFLGNVAGADGGGLHLQDGLEATATGTRFEGNRGRDGGAVFVRNLPVAFDGVELVDNEATRFGGGAFVATGAVLDVVGGSVEANGSASSGGGIHVGLEGSLSLEATTLRSNAAGGSGGGLAADQATSVTVAEGVLFDRNEAGSSGGGVWLSIVDEDVVMTGVVLRANTAVESGGGISSDPGSSLTLIDATVGGPDPEDGNEAGNLGGGVEIGSGSLRAETTVFENNGATRGGGLYAGSCGVELTDVTVRGNQASLTGGGATFAGCGVELVGSLFEDNVSVGVGGGMAVDLGTTIVLSAGTVVRANSAAVDGGGLHVTAGTLEISAGTLGGETPEDANRAGGYGGGAWLGDGTTATTLDTTVRNNVAGGKGGGFAIMGGSTLGMQDSILRDNIASDGGGLLVETSTGSSATLINTDFGDNLPNDFAVE